MSTPFYARYIPPKRVKDSKAKEGSGKRKAETKDVGKEQQVGDLTGGVGGKTEKKRKKRKLEEDQLVGDGESKGSGLAGNVAEAASDAITDKAEREQEPRPAKRKKQKKENLKNADLEQEEDNEEEIKHGKVFAKFQKSSRIADAVRQKQVHAQDEEEEAEEIEQPQEDLHDLVPLPQPVPVLDSEELPTFSVLPTWLEKPVTVPANTTIPFEDLNVNPKLTRQLAKHGYNSAFAIQCAVLPLLLPGEKHYFGDLCVSAATGSGKTIAYILPMVESMRENAHITRLRGIVVVPTRELVAQVREVAELCAAGTGLKIGTALGSHSLAAEQEALVRKGQQYARGEATELLNRAQKRVLRGVDEDDALLDDSIAPWVLPYHVPEYTSAVDILICTPGRLVEHIQSTHGFNLNDLQWLVIDEADRLLDQSFQEWADAVIDGLEKPTQKLGPLDQILSSFWEPLEKRYVRKIVLSATMTRDLQKLGGLKLRRPTLVSVVGDAATMNEENAIAGATDSAEGFELPKTLKEWAVHIEEPANKPLYLLQLLEEHMLSKPSTNGHEDDADDETDDSVPSSPSESESDSLSDSSSSSDESSEATSDEASETTAETNSSKSRSQSAPAAASTVLVFTNTTENAARLSHLLAHLKPTWASSISTLTKSSTSSSGRKALAAFRNSNNQSTIRILIATERAARGLDLPSLGHVVNYDIPNSATAYVHRVGRTARAGKIGHAWTMVEGREGWWFWNKVARGEEVRREGEVEKVKLTLTDADDLLRGRYEEALERLRDDVELEGKMQRRKVGKSEKASRSKTKEA